MSKLTDEKIKFYKVELAKRYKYLYENIIYIFAPFVHKQTQEEYKNMLEKMNNKNIPLWKIMKNSITYIKSFDVETLSLLERFLLETTSIEETEFYKKLEFLKQDKEYLEKVKKGCILLDEKNKNLMESVKEKFTIWKLLINVRNYINNQSSDLKNKKLKLEALDEYFRLDRYKNDGKIWKSGFELLFCDVNNNLIMSAIVDKNNIKKIPSREKNDIGIKNNEFINCFSNTSLIKSKDNSIHLTEKEKQDVYLSLHEELPWDLEIECNLEEEPKNKRPDNTYPCNKKFYIDEKEIFVKDNLFFQLCPKCGYMVIINDKLLTDNIKNRIIDNCNKDKNLYRKMELYSELKALDLNSTKEQKKLLKKL